MHHVLLEPGTQEATTPFHGMYVHYDNSEKNLWRFSHFYALLARLEQYEICKMTIDTGGKKRGKRVFGGFQRFRHLNAANCTLFCTFLPPVSRFECGAQASLFGVYAHFQLASAHFCKNVFRFITL